MSLLAEVDDKIFSMYSMLLLSLLLAGCSSVLGLLRWWFALPSALVMCFGDWVLFQELRAPGMWHAIRTEMGCAWVIGSLVVWNGPFMLCWYGLVLFHRRVWRDGQSVAGLCIGCGYDLTGNTSGTCPECGAEV